MSDLQGFDQLERRLMALGDAKQIKKLAKAGVTAGQRVIAKGIKNKIPIKYREIKKTIGFSLKAGKGDNAGTVVAKVGVAVGKKMPKESDVLGRTARKRDKKGGVGIGLRNAHWMFLGTAQRSTKKGRNTGRMQAPLQGVVQAGVAASQSEAANKIKQNIADGLSRIAKG